MKKSILIFFLLLCIIKSNAQKSFHNSFSVHSCVVLSMSNTNNLLALPGVSYQHIFDKHWGAEVLFAYWNYQTQGISWGNFRFPPEKRTSSTEGQQFPDFLLEMSHYSFIDVVAVYQYQIKHHALIPFVGLGYTQGMNWRLERIIYYDFDTELIGYEKKENFLGGVVGVKYQYNFLKDRLFAGGQVRFRLYPNLENYFQREAGFQIGVNF